MKPVPHHDPECPAWMLTFGDTMGLLLTFFVMMISFTSFESDKLTDFMGTMRGAFSVAPDAAGRSTPEMAASRLSEEPVSLDRLEPLVRQVFASALGTRFGRQMFCGMVDEGMAIIVDMDGVFKPGSLELNRGQEDLFRSLGVVARSLDNEMRVTAVLPEGTAFSPALAQTAWAFAAKRAMVFRDEVAGANRLPMQRFSIGSRVAEAQEPLPTDGTRLSRSYVEILVVEKRTIKDVLPEEIVIRDRWM
ncbi:MAG: hypothetical protein HY343_02865 [Lentisphaerae bacterium]|nr:hypothetical protein [Lentisphaerota bacterium]